MFVLIDILSIINNKCNTLGNNLFGTMKELETHKCDEYGVQIRKYPGGIYQPRKTIYNTLLDAGFTFTRELVIEALAEKDFCVFDLES